MTILRMRYGHFSMHTIFLRTSTSLALTMYGGISNFPVLSVLHHLSQTSCTEILAFHSFPPYQYLSGTHHVQRILSMLLVVTRKEHETSELTFLLLICAKNNYNGFINAAIKPNCLIHIFRSSSISIGD